MKVKRNARVFPIVILVALLAASPLFAQEASPLSGGLALEGITLTDFGSYFSLPVGLRIDIDYRIASLATGLSVSTGASAGWWMESFRDTFNFRPELVPVMIPIGGGIGLRWEPIQAFSLDLNAQLGFVIEWAPGAPPNLLLCFSPGIDVRWFFLERAGISLRMGWAWVGADPIWSGPSVRFGPIFR